MKKQVVFETVDTPIQCQLSNERMLIDQMIDRLKIAKKAGATHVEVYLTEKYGDLEIVTSFTKMREETDAEVTQREKTAKQAEERQRQYEERELQRLLTKYGKQLKSEGSTCLHDQCPSCNGTGINKITGGMCVHGISCTCPKCGIR